MKKVSQKELKKHLTRISELKSQKSEIAKEEKAIKDLLLGQLDLSETESMKVGETTIRKKVSSYGINVSTLGVKVSEATNDLTKSLLDEGKTNLLSIKPKTALLYQLQEQGDSDTQAMLEGLGVEVIEKYTLEIK